MGQKVNPISNRLGIIRGWDSNWYGGKNYGDMLFEDSKIRNYLNARLAKASVSRIVIERTLKLITITVCTSRPGMIIGKAGSEVDKLKEEIKKITDKEVQINIFEIKRPELDAVIVATNIARQLEGKIAYRRAVKTAIASTMRMGAEGIKVQVSGRLNGAEMARSEMYKEGRTPLHTFRADIDYALAEALTKVGLLGIKVWICRGEVYEKKDLAPSFAAPKEYARKNDNPRGGERGDKPFKRRKGGEHGDRPDRGERGGYRPERGERSDRPERSNRPERGGDNRNNQKRIVKK
jgi:small subunit ribosomal protein S3